MTSQVAGNAETVDRGINGLSVDASLRLIELTTDAARVAISDPRNRDVADQLLRRLQRQIAALEDDVAQAPEFED